VAELCRVEMTSASERRSDDPIERIMSLVKPVRYEDEEIAQSIEKVDDCSLRLRRITATNKRTEEVYEFGLAELDEDKVGFRVSGKELAVDLATRFKDSVIKYYKDGESGNYQSELRIETGDVEETRALIDAVKAAIGACRD
jgi:hypothetical protein